LNEELGMGFVGTSPRAAGARRARLGSCRGRALLRAGIWLCFGLALGCTREPQALLSLAAPIPEQFSKSTTLELGDPTVQRQLELSGAIASLPFTANWQNISGGPQTIEAFRAGVLDGGSVGDTPPIHALFTGIDVKIISVQVRKQPVYQLALAPGVSIGSIEALRGKRIAYSPGQAQGALVLRVLAKAGLSQGDVQLVQLISTEFKDALANHQVDVAPLGGTSLRRYLREYAADAGSAIPHGVADGYSFFYVRTAILGEAPKAAALREYARIRTRSLIWQQQHPDEWVEAYYVKDQGLTAEEGRYVVEGLGESEYPRDWSEAIARTQQTIDLLAAATGQTAFDAARLFDRRFESVGADVADEVLGRASQIVESAR
jgi:sulfonate transport system substrate-binding protein